MIYIINSEENPAFKLTWVLCIMALPIFGTFFYIYVKAQIGTRYIGKRLNTLKEETEAYMRQDMEIIDAMKKSKLANRNLSFYLENIWDFLPMETPAWSIIPLARTNLKALKRELKKAKHFIFMEYFIVEGGEMWDEIRHILEEKVAEGVEVRFMYDGMCSISKLPSDYPWYLRRRGIRCKVFNPITPMVSTIQNNRDHRKICVIDGKVGFTGGVNLADSEIAR